MQQPLQDEAEEKETEEEPEEPDEEFIDEVSMDVPTVFNMWFVTAV